MEDVQTACPSCDAINRLPRSRLGSRPKCGRCHLFLFQGRPVELTGARFEKHIRGDLPLVVDFWAPWCGYCQRMAPAFTEAAASLEPEVRLGTVDTDAEPGLAARYAVKGLPTIVLFRQGQEVARQSGAMGEAEIVGWTRSHL